ncbi:MAG TPA: endonuclease/exonuclease/phosphatase family protein [Streptosporangiaceae bacterium]|nr:endonuclease/exonuclease/phosphatase family protein [Streptosporangiaceae bacterium]
MASAVASRGVCDHDQVSSSHLQWAVAGGLAAWAGARLAGADRLRSAEGWVVPSLSFTPQMAAAAVAALPLLRSGSSKGAATLAAAALTAAVVPRAIPRLQPPVDGAELRVLTSNLLVGRADAESLVSLVISSRADVLFLQELTDGAAIRLQKAGLDSVLPYQVLEPVVYGPKGSGIWARYPLRDGLAVARASRSRPVASLDIPGGKTVQLVCVHLRPPRPSRSPSGAARWRTEMATLPGPGDAPVIMAGDFNATLDHARFRQLLRLGYVDAAVQAGRGLIPTWGPRPGGEMAVLAIDHILLDPRCAVRAFSAHRLPGTDHRALYAQIQLPR